MNRKTFLKTGLLAAVAAPLARLFAPNEDAVVVNPADIPEPIVSSFNKETGGWDVISITRVYHYKDGTVMAVRTPPQLPKFGQIVSTVHYDGETGKHLWDYNLIHA